MRTQPCRFTDDAGERRGKHHGRLTATAIDVATCPSRAPQSTARLPTVVTTNWVQASAKLRCACSGWHREHADALSALSALRCGLRNRRDWPHRFRCLDRGRRQNASLRVVTTLESALLYPWNTNRVKIQQSLIERWSIFGGPVELKLHVDLHRACRLP